MWEMTLDSSLEGIVMVSDGAISPSEVEDHLKDILVRSLDSHPTLSFCTWFQVTLQCSQT